MTRKRISRRDVAELLGVTYRTIHSRFNGESEWTLSECLKIRDTYFPDMRLEYLFTADEKQSRKNKNTDRSAIPISILPNLFTLCILQAFAAPDSARCFCQTLCHFCSFGSATCPIADKLRGVLSTVSANTDCAIPPIFNVVFPRLRYASCYIQPVLSALAPLLRPHIKRAGKISFLIMM